MLIESSAVRRIGADKGRHLIRFYVLLKLEEDLEVVGRDVSETYRHVLEYAQGEAGFSGAVQNL